MITTNSETFSHPLISCPYSDGQRESQSNPAGLSEGNLGDFEVQDGSCCLYTKPAHITSFVISFSLAIFAMSLSIATTMVAYCFCNLMLSKAQPSNELKTFAYYCPDVAAAFVWFCVFLIMLLQGIPAKFLGNSMRDDSLYITNNEYNCLKLKAACVFLVVYHVDVLFAYVFDFFIFNRSNHSFLEERLLPKLVSMLVLGFFYVVAHRCKGDALFVRTVLAAYEKMMHCFESPKAILTPDMSPRGSDIGFFSCIKARENCCPSWSLKV